MPKAKSWKCEICDEPVSELGAYVKRTTIHYSHAHCFAKKEYDLGFERGQQTLLNEQAERQRELAERERREREITQARERAELERRAEVAERERTNRILAAQKIPLPPTYKVEPKKEEKNAQQEERPDRFKLIDLE